MPGYDATSLLNSRDVETLVDIAEGLTQKEAAKKRKLSHHTIRHRRVLVCAKLHARNKTHAIALAFRQGFLQ